MPNTSSLRSAQYGKLAPAATILQGIIKLITIAEFKLQISYQPEMII